MALTANQRLCKQPAETLKFQMDFASVLGSSENITSITSISSEKVGGYTSDLVFASTGLVSATPTGTVEMYISEGTLGSTYRVEILVNTDAAQIIEGDGILYVTDQ
jgi:hypothetical protein|tara:strand:- start:1943 stop:2260 length:318 start_codon:yes stop_codon:yes gene_type:complete